MKFLLAMLIAQSSFAAQPSCMDKEFQLGLFYRLNCARGSIDSCQVVEAAKTSGFIWAALAVATANAMIALKKQGSKIEPFDLRKLATHLLKSNLLFKRTDRAVGELLEALERDDLAAGKKYRQQLTKILDDVATYDGQSFIADEKNAKLLNEEKALKKLSPTTMGDILKTALVKGIQAKVMAEMVVSTDTLATAHLDDFLKEMVIVENKLKPIGPERVNAELDEMNVATRNRTTNYLKTGGELGLNVGLGVGLMALGPAILSARSKAFGFNFSFRDSIDLQSYLNISSDKINVDTKALAGLFENREKAEKTFAKHPAFCTALRQVNDSLRLELANSDAQNINCNGGTTHITYEAASAHGLRHFTLDISRDTMTLQSDRKYNLGAGFDPNGALVWKDFEAQDGFVQKVQVQPKELSQTYVANLSKCESRDLAEASQQRCDIGEDIHRNSLFIIQARNKCAEVQEASLSPALLESGKTIPGN